jgi:hypothetical protein
MRTEIEKRVAMIGCASDPGYHFTATVMIGKWTRYTAYASDAKRMTGVFPERRSALGKLPETIA